MSRLRNPSLTCLNFLLGFFLRGNFMAKRDFLSSSSFFHVLQSRIASILPLPSSSSGFPLSQELRARRSGRRSSCSSGGFRSQPKNLLGKGRSPPIERGGGGWAVSHPLEEEEAVLSLSFAPLLHCRWEGGRSASASFQTAKQKLEDVLGRRGEGVEGISPFTTSPHAKVRL